MSDRQILPTEGGLSEVAGQIEPGAVFTLNASGFSMKPEIAAGAVLQIRAVSPEEITVGDIALFLWQGHLVAHRIVARNRSEGVFWQMGDGQYRPFKIEGKEIVGKVIAVEGKGKIRHLHRPWNRFRGKLLAFFLFHKFLLIDNISQVRRRILAGD